MAVHDQKRREIVFQILFSLDFSPDNEKDVGDFLMKELLVSRSCIKQSRDVCVDILKNISEIDASIKKYLIGYELNRIATSEKNILRLGVYEGKYQEKPLPPAIIIAESTRLCRKFATAESASFVHAILDAIFKDCYDPLEIRGIDANTAHV